MKSIQVEIKNQLGEDIGNKVLKQFKNGISDYDINEDFEDIILDFVNNNAEVKVTLTGLGSYGEFPIDILNFGHLYWVSAQEYDPIQYFKTIEDAIECAEFEYDSFLNGSLDEN